MGTCRLVVGGFHLGQTMNGLREWSYKWEYNRGFRTGLMAGFFGGAILGIIVGALAVWVVRQ